MTIHSMVMRGALIPVNHPERAVYFQFNPQELQDEKQVKYENTVKTGSIEPDIQYTGGGARTISFTLVIDGFHPPPGKELLLANSALGIKLELERLRMLIYPEDRPLSVLGPLANDGKVMGDPPHCLFWFGPQVMPCRVQKLSITNKKYNAVLAPVRAEVQVTLVEEPLTKGDRLG